MKTLGVILVGICLLLGCTMETAEPSAPKEDNAMGLEGGPDEVRRNSGDAKTGWSVSGNLIVGDTTKQVQLQADFATPGEYTLQFNIGPAVGSNTAAVAEATITWSVEGNSVQRRVTITPGLSVSGVGQAVRIQMNDASVGVAGTIPDGKSYNVSAQVARGPRPTTAVPPTLIPSGDGTAGKGTYIALIGTPVNVPIPENAGISSVYVAVAGFVAATGVAAQIDFPIVTHMVPDSLGPLRTQRYDPRTYQWVPLVPGATILRLQNFNTVSGVAYAYYVAFGVDG